MIQYPVCLTAWSCSWLSLMFDPSGLVDTISSSFNVGVWNSVLNSS